MSTKVIELTTRIYKLERLLGMHYLEIPKSVVAKLGTLKIRLHCIVNNSITFQCGLMALGEGKAYISLNNARMKKLGVKEGDKVSVVLKEDLSKYGMDVPEELLELFKQDKVGKARFDKLKPGMQRYVIFYVAGVKNTQKKIDRAILLIENLKKLSPGKETFREMLGLPQK